MQSFIKVHPTDVWSMLLCTIRYSLGRQTYMPSECYELLLRYNDSLDSHQLMQIHKEVEEALNSKSIDATNRPIWEKLSTKAQEFSFMSDK